MLCGCMQAYHAVAAALKPDRTTCSTTSNVQGRAPPSATDSHHILMKKLREECGVDSPALQKHADSMVPPTSYPEVGILR